MPANNQCRTFTTLSDFKTFTSPASLTGSGESAAPTTGLHGAGIPGWRLELSRRPLRRVVGWTPYTIPSSPRYHTGPCRMYRETLECGHKMERFITWDAPAKRRRCRECGRQA